MQAAAQREVEAVKRQLSASNAALEQQRAGAARSGANSLRVEMAQRTERHATELGDLAGALLELRNIVFIAVSRLCVPRGLAMLTHVGSAPESGLARRLNMSRGSSVALWLTR